MSSIQPRTRPAVGQVTGTHDEEILLGGGPSAAAFRGRGETRATGQNVGSGERAVSIAAGAILLLLGINRRDLMGVAIAGVGGALALRGATGRCGVYQAMGIDTSQENERLRRAHVDDAGVLVNVTYLINKSPEELYSFWRNFGNLPRIMSHLESVRVLDEKRSHWVAKAPSIYGGTAEWDAEITADEPNSRIAWQSLPGGDVEHRGSIRFLPALGNRGTKVRVSLHYDPPAGKLGRWIAKLFGEEPEQQIHEDLRRFKRMMELGEVPSTEGQPRGTCRGRGESHER